MKHMEDRPTDLNRVLGLRSDKDMSVPPQDGSSLAQNENLTHADQADKPQRAKRRTRRFDGFRFLFFTSIIATISFTIISLLQPSQMMAEKQIHLLTFAAGSIMILLWLLRGAGTKLGLFPDKDLTLKRELRENVHVNWIDGLDEPAILCDKHGLPIQCNQAYARLSEEMLHFVEGGNEIMTLESLFGGSLEAKSEIYQLAQSVVKTGNGEKTLIIQNHNGRTQQRPFKLKSSAITHNRILWRLWPIGQNSVEDEKSDDLTYLAEDAPIGFFAAKADGKINYMNGWMRKHFGLGSSLGGMEIEDLFGEHGAKPIFAHRRIRQLQSVNTTMKSSNGRDIAVKTFASWSGEGSKALAQVYVIPDKGKPTQIRQSAGDDTGSLAYGDEAQTLIDSAPFGALTLSGDSLENAEIKGCNEAFSNLVDGRTLVGTPLVDLFKTDSGEVGDSAKHNAQIHQALWDSVHKPSVLQLGSDAHPYVQVSVMLNELDQPVLAYIFDLTEQRALEERLAQGEKMQAIGQLAGGIAHDFNNVLQGIVFNTDQLKMRHPIGDPSYENLKKIMEFVQRSKSLTSQLLAYAREQTFKHEIFNPTEFLTDFERLLRQTIDQRVTLNIQHGEAIPWIKADKNQIETAIINLAANARDAMLIKQNSGTLNIRTHRSTAKAAHDLGFGFIEEGDYLLIEVEDNGSGIAPENMQKIFNPFFTTKAVGVGTGLGLASVMGIIKQSGGYICPTSRVGHGTIFRIYLPALKEEDVPADLKNPPLRVATNRPKDITGRGRILFVEDEDGVRGIGANLLRSRGYEVVEAEDGDVAFEIIETEPVFDLIISDVVMPGRDGPTLINDAKDMLKQTQVVFISGYADQDLAKKLEEHKEVQFLPKPFSMRALAELVKDMLGTAKSDRAA